MSGDPVGLNGDDQDLQSNEVLRKFAPLPYQSLDDDGKILTANNAWLDLLGYDLDEVKGEHISRFLTPNSVNKFESRFPKFQEEGSVSGVEFVMVRSDGENIPVSFDGHIEYAEDGSVARTHCQFRDISAQKEKEAQLTESRKTFEDLFHGINDAVFMHDLDGDFLRVNQTAQERLGYTEDELLELSPSDIDAPGQVEGMDDRKEILQNSGSLTFETAHVTKSGEVIPVEITSSLVELFGDDVVLSVARDISERREKSRDSELFRTLVNQANDGILVIDETSGKIIDINQTASEILRYKRGDLIGLTVPDISDQFESVEAYHEHLSEDANENISSLVDEHRRRDGSTIPVEYSAKTVTVKGNRYRVAVVRDISDRIQREQELRRMKRAVDASGHAIYITDSDGCIEYVNTAFIEITGYSEDEALGANPRILKSGKMSDGYYEELWETVLSGNVWEEEVINRQKSGALYHAHQTIAPIFDDEETIEGFVAIQTDISEQIRREQALQKREQIFRQLHATTQDFLGSNTESDVFDGIVEALSSALDFTFFGVMEFDRDKGRLETRSISPDLREVCDEFPALEPGDDALWNVFGEGESRLLKDIDPKWMPKGVVDEATNLLGVPIDDYGLIYLIATETESIEDEDVKLIDLLSTTAATVLSRLDHESQLSNVSQELSLQESRGDELEELIATIETIQNRLANCDTKESLQKAVCEELTNTERIDFAWIGQPEITETQLLPAAWAGSENGFLYAVTLEGGEEDLPSQRAAKTRQTVTISNISTHISEMSWPNDAISRGFQSTLSIPLLHNDVLYGVLTLYSSEQGAFESLYQNVIEEIASLFTQYLSIVNIQSSDHEGKLLELEFGLSDESYPLQLLAEETGTTIAFEAVLRSEEETVEILATVRTGELATVVEEATKISSIAEVTQFGGSGSNQVILTIRRPFLATEVMPHGGRLIHSVSSPDGTTARVTLPENVSVRPVAESLANQYQDIELLARRETTTETAGETVRTEEALTERQLEILKAAYFGGYYETPRKVTGEDLASSFDISNSVVHGHLQSAHRRILERILDSESDN